MRKAWLPLLLISLLPPVFGWAGVRVVGGITLEENVDKNHAKYFEEDIKRLAWLPVKSADPELQALLKIGGVTNAELVSWLEARVQYIVGENFRFEDRAIKIAARPHAYEYPNLMPGFEKPTRPATGVARLAMANIGTALYLMGKDSRSLLELDIGKNKVRSTSPRIGLIQIGEALFNPKHVLNPDPWAMANTISRLSTLFHESRHSDGRKVHTGFTHAVCGPDHHFHGLPACDRNLNGPYTIDAVVLRNFADACTWCSVGEKEKLKLQYLESFSRVIKETRFPISEEDRSAKIAMAQAQLALCEIENPGTAPCAAAGGKTVAELDAEIQRLRTQIEEILPSTHWDDQPEGKR